MELAEGIRKLGYRRWYERQLIESHLNLVVCIVSMLAALAALEGFRLGAPGWEMLLRLAVIVAGGPVSIRSLVRYRAGLEVAMRAAEHSTCTQCSAYGLLEIAPNGRLAPREPAAVTTGLRPSALAVRCRKCGHEWTIG